MAELLISNIEPETIKHLKLQAKQNHRSLQQELKFIIEAATKMSMAEARKTSIAWHKKLSNGSFSDSTKLLRKDRNS